MKKLSLALALTLMLSLAACGSAPPAENLLSGRRPSGGELSGEAADAVVEFSLSLARQSGPGTLLSPLSALFALGMTANGAEGETLAQMESVFGLDTGALNGALSALAASLGDEAQAANSLWIRDTDDFTVSEDFLSVCGEYYDAGVFTEPFDDSTLRAINSWVSEQTGGLIGEILDEIPPDAVMYLVNAIGFSADWESIYREDQVRQGVFTTSGGEELQADFMYGEESLYLEGEGFTGFMKPYEGGRYAFTALLPEEGSSPSELLEGLGGAELRELLASPQAASVSTSLPRFEGGSSLELSDMLSAMGMTDIFDPERSELCGLGSSSMGSLYVSRVLHETFIAVDERGTEAGAATAVEVMAEGAAEVMQSVYLDRPFVYLIVDTASGVPLFIGTLERP